MVRQDGKRPDGLTLIPLEGGRSRTWNVTDVCSTADPYIDPAVLAMKLNTSICAPATRLSADRGRDPGSYQWVGHLFSVGLDSANFACERGGQRASVFVPAHFNYH